MKKLLAVATAWLIAASAAFAQNVNPVTTQPYGVTTANASSTIAVTNTFQTVWTRSTNTRGRAGCTIQNTGTNTMYVAFGATPLTATSVKLNAGQSLNCTVGGIVLQDTVSITGTAGETFYAAQQ